MADNSFAATVANRLARQRKTDPPDQIDFPTSCSGRLPSQVSHASPPQQCYYLK